MLPLGIFISLLLGICTVKISFFIHIFSVFVSFSFMSLCYSRRSLGFGVTGSHLIFTEVNIANSLLKIRKAEVQRYNSEQVMSLYLRFCL